MLVLVIAVVGSCERLAGEYVPPEVAPDLAKPTEAGERLISRLDRPPKHVHFSVKLVVLSHKDAEKVRIYILKDARPANSRSVDRSSKEAQEKYDLGTLSFSKLQALLQFIRTQTKGRIIQAPQFITLNHYVTTIRVGEVFRHHEFLMGCLHAAPAEPSGSKPKSPPFSPDIRLLVIPHVTGPDNSIILTVSPDQQLFEVFEGGMLGQLTLPQTEQRTVVMKMMLRDGETVIISHLRGQWRGEKVNLFICITPTVVNFEKDPEIRDSVKRAQEELDREFSLEEEAPPQMAAPGSE